MGYNWVEASVNSPALFRVSAHRLTLDVTHSLVTIDLYEHLGVNFSQSPSQILAPKKINLISYLQYSSCNTLRSNASDV
jgi:hypothetical protein